MKQNALRELVKLACCCFVHYCNWKFETLFFCRGNWDCS